MARDRPKPLVGERAFDTGHLLRSLLPEKLEPALVQRLVDRLADELELDPERIRAWSLVRSVEDSLWSLSRPGRHRPGREKRPGSVRHPIRPPPLVSTACSGEASLAPVRRSGTPISGGCSSSG
ncbi:MAG: aminoglycoside phosphotransferase family protein [Actinomycetota bacterium]